MAGGTNVGQTSYTTTDCTVHVLLPFGSCVVTLIHLPLSFTSPLLSAQSSSAPPRALPHPATNTRKSQAPILPIHTDNFLLGKSQRQVSWVKCCVTRSGGFCVKPGSRNCSASGCEETAPEEEHSHIQWVSSQALAFAWLSVQELNTAATTWARSRVGQSQGRPFPGSL